MTRKKKTPAKTGPGAPWTVVTRKLRTDIVSVCDGGPHAPITLRPYVETTEIRATWPDMDETRVRLEPSSGALTTFDEGCGLALRVIVDALQELESKMQAADGAAVRNAPGARRAAAWSAAAQRGMGPKRRRK